MANVYCTVGNEKVAINGDVIRTLRMYASKNRDDYDMKGATKYIVLGKIDLSRIICEEMEIDYTPGEEEDDDESED